MKLQQLQEAKYIGLRKRPRSDRLTDDEVKKLKTTVRKLVKGKYNASHSYAAGYTVLFLDVQQAVTALTAKFGHPVEEKLQPGNKKFSAYNTHVQGGDYDYALNQVKKYFWVKWKVGNWLIQLSTRPCSRFNRNDDGKYEVKVVQH